MPCSCGATDCDYCGYGHENTTSARRLGSPSGDSLPRTGGHNKQEVSDVSHHTNGPAME